MKKKKEERMKKRKKKKKKARKIKRRKSMFALSPCSLLKRLKTMFLVVLGHDDLET